MASREHPAEDRPYSVFDAVANHDLEGIVEEYVKNARNTIISYLSMRKRWGAHQGEEVKAGKCVDPTYVLYQTKICSVKPPNFCVMGIVGI